MEPMVAGIIIKLLPGRLSELMSLLVQGMGYWEIMQSMDLDLPTVKKYRRRIQIKLFGRIDEEELERFIEMLRTHKDFPIQQNKFSNLRYL